MSNSARMAARQPPRCLRKQARPAVCRATLRHLWGSLVGGKQVAVARSHVMATMQRTAVHGVSMFSHELKVRRRQVGNALAWWRLLCLQTMHTLSAMQAVCLAGCEWPGDIECSSCDAGGSAAMCGAVVDIDAGL